MIWVSFQGKGDPYWTKRGTNASPHLHHSIIGTTCMNIHLNEKWHFMQVVWRGEGEDGGGGRREEGRVGGNSRYKNVICCLNCCCFELQSHKSFLDVYTYLVTGHVDLQAFQPHLPHFCPEGKPGSGRNIYSSMQDHGARSTQSCWLRQDIVNVPADVLCGINYRLMISIFLSEKTHTTKIPYLSCWMDAIEADKNVIDESKYRSE